MLQVIFIYVTIYVFTCPVKNSCHYHYKCVANVVTKRMFNGKIPILSLNVCIHKIIIFDIITICVSLVPFIILVKKIFPIKSNRL